MCCDIVCKVNPNYWKLLKCLSKLSSKVFVKLFCFNSKIIRRLSDNY